LVRLFGELSRTPFGKLRLVFFERSLVAIENTTHAPAAATFRRIRRDRSDGRLIGTNGHIDSVKA
jgi:hypothetical protein